MSAKATSGRFEPRDRFSPGYPRETGCCGGSSFWTRPAVPYARISDIACPISEESNRADHRIRAEAACVLHEAHQRVVAGLVRHLRTLRDLAPGSCAVRP